MGISIRGWTPKKWKLSWRACQTSARQDNLESKRVSEQEQCAKAYKNVMDKLSSAESISERPNICSVSVFGRKKAVRWCSVVRPNTSKKPNRTQPNILSTKARDLAASHVFFVEKTLKSRFCHLEKGKNSKDLKNAQEIIYFSYKILKLKHLWKYFQ